VAEKLMEKQWQEFKETVLDTPRLFFEVVDRDDVRRPVPGGRTLAELPGLEGLIRGAFFAGAVSLWSLVAGSLDHEVSDIDVETLEALETELNEFAKKGEADAQDPH